MLLRTVVVLPFKMIISIIFRFGIKDDFELDARGFLLGILGGGVSPCSPNPNPISDQNMSLFTPVLRSGIQSPCPFSDLAFEKLYHHYLDYNSNKLKRFLKIHFEFTCFSFFLTHLELKLLIPAYTSFVPLKTIPVCRQ